jgi:hypothetical protein
MDSSRVKPLPHTLSLSHSTPGGKRGHQNFKHHQSHRRAADRLAAADPFGPGGASRYYGANATDGLNRAHAVA